MNRWSYCSQCGSTLAEAANFCSRCGEPVPQACVECGHYNAPKARFCVSCGVVLAAAPAEAASQQGSQQSERKFVTIMFVDMIDSLAAIRYADPEEAQELFTRVLGLMTEAVHTCAGTVVRTMGDGILALFGAPSAQEDHAMRACHAALRVIETVRRARPEIPGLNVRVGLHSGLVVVGQWVNDLSFNYDATGVVVHIASRLQNAAQPGTAVMTAATRKLVHKETVIKSLGLLKVKGLEEPIELFELCATHVARPISAPSSDEPFVGRASELAELAGALRSTLFGKGRFVAIVGEPGIGKSRFIERFLDLHTGSVAIHTAKIARYNGTIPFHPIRDLVNSVLGLESVDAKQREAALLSRLEALSLGGMGLERPLADLLEVGVAPPEWRSVDSVTRGRMTAMAVRTLLLKESEDRPLILVIEDLQRADSATANVIGMLADSIAQRRILFLVSFRPDFAYAWANKEAYRQLRLDRLSSDEIDELIGRLVGASATPDLRQLLSNWSQGNPLFLHETVLALVDAGILAGDPGSRTVMRPPVELEPPDSVASMIAERIDRLPANLKDLLLAASILGEQFSTDSLSRIIGRSSQSLWEQLQALEDNEFVRQVTLLPMPIFSFRHTLVQEVCYGSLLKSRRRELHAAAFAALLTDDKAGLSPSVERLAYHSFRAALWEDAYRYCRAAGQNAVYRSAYREAVRHFENAMMALARADPESRRLEEAIDVALELRSAHIPLFQVLEAGRILADVYQRTLQLGNERRLAQVTGFMAGHAYMTQSPRASATLSETALRLAKQIGDDSLQIVPNVHLGQALHGLGEFQHSVDVLKRNLDILPRLERPRLGLPMHPLVMTWRWMALSLAELGSFDEAMHLATDIVLGDTLPQQTDRLYSKATIGFVFLVRGDFEAARDATAEAMAVAEGCDLPFMTPVVASQLGLILAYLESPEEGLKLARRAVHAAEELGVSAARSRLCARLAECCLLAGNPVEALRHAQTSLDFAENAGEQGYACYALRLRGKILAHSGDLASAHSDLMQAMTRAKTLSMAPLIAKCAFDLAGLNESAGDAEGARNLMAQAFAGFRQLGMDAWTARAEMPVATASS